MIDFEHQVLGFDFETQGLKDEYMLQPWRVSIAEAWISACAFTRGSTSVGKLYPSKPVIEATLEAAVVQDLYVCGWNLTFDCALLIALDLEDLAFRVKWLDGLLLWRHWFVEPEGDDVPKQQRKSYSLENAVKEFFPDEAGFKDFKNFQTRDPAELQMLLHRCKEDTRFAVRLSEFFWQRLNPQQQRAALIEARCIPQVARANVVGLRSSKPHAEALRAQLRQIEKLTCETLLVNSPEVAGVNLGSPKQLATLLFETWRLPIQGVSEKTKAPSTDKNALHELAFIDPRARQLKEVREAKNNCTKYAEATLKSMEYNGGDTIRPQARIFGTYTSRMTYSSGQKAKEQIEKTTKAKGLHIVERNIELPTGVALHQWKRGKDFRRLIRPPEGYGLCELDAAGQEFRWMAVASGDETMLSLCAPGEDAHSYMGAQIAQCDYRDLIARVKAEDTDAEFQRKMGKFANLSFQYRVGSKKATMKARTDYELDVEEPFIAQIQGVYRASYVGVGGAPGERNGGYWGRQILKCKHLGYAETYAGRRVQLKGPWAGRDAWGQESTAINYPIQGTGGDQKYLALAVARNMLPQWDGYFYYELHDGLFFIFPLAKLEAAAHAFRAKLSNLPYKQAWGCDLPIQFPFDAKISTESWGDLKNL